MYYISITFLHYRHHNELINFSKIFKTFIESRINDLHYSSTAKNVVKCLRESTPLWNVQVALSGTPYLATRKPNK